MLISTLACLWDSFSPPGLPHPALIWGFVPSLIASCYAVFSGRSALFFFFWRETEEQWIWGRGGVEAGLGEGEGPVCSLDLLSARKIKTRKTPENWRRILVATNRLITTFVRTRCFQSPCNWDQTLPQIVKIDSLIIPNKCMLNEWPNA